MNHKLRLSNVTTLAKRTIKYSLTPYSKMKMNGLVK